MAIETNNFFTALFSLIGLINNGCSFYFHSTCTTPTLESRHFYGPAWLTVYDTNFNILGLSKSFRRKNSVLTADGDFSFQFTPYYGTKLVNKAENFRYKLMELLGDKHYKNVIEAYEQSNKLIWKKFLSTKVQPVYLKEDFYSRLLLHSLEDQESYIHRFFLNWEKQKIVIDHIKKDASLPWGEMIPTSTNFFWVIQENKIKPLKFTEHTIMYADKEEALSENTLASIIELLENGIIVPDIFLIIMLESLLGHVRLAGGLHQFAYFETYRKAFLESLNKNDYDELQLYQSVNEQKLNHWGSHVLEPNLDVLDIIEDEDCVFDKCVEFYKDYSFDTAIEDMIQFRKYHRWGKLICDKRNL